MIIPRLNHIHPQIPIRVFCRSTKTRNGRHPCIHLRTGSNKTIFAVPIVLVSSFHSNGYKSGRLRLMPQKQRNLTCSYPGHKYDQQTDTCTIFLERRSFLAGLVDPKNRCSADRILFQNINFTLVLLELNHLMCTAIIVTNQPSYIFTSIIFIRLVIGRYALSLTGVDYTYIISFKIVK